MQKDESALFFSNISRFQRLYAKGLSKRLGIHGVRTGYIDILSNLWQRDNVTQKSLHAHLGIEQATLSNTLSRMERDNLVTRSRNPKDRRHMLISLTSKGRSLEPTVLAAIEDMQSIANQGLTINDRRYFNRILRQMSELVDADLQDNALILFDALPESE